MVLLFCPMHKINHSSCMEDAIANLNKKDFKTDKIEQQKSDIE